MLVKVMEKKIGKDCLSCFKGVPKGKKKVDG
jgi:hypothetical protein